MRLFIIVSLFLVISPPIIAQETEFTFSNRIVIYDSLGNNSSDERYFLSDVNSDNLKDIIVRKDNQVLYVLENTGTGGFSDPDSLTNIERNTKKIILFDLDLDGDKDILYSMESYDGYRTYYQENVNGVFKKSVKITTSDVSRRDIYFNDINNDGKIDILSYYEDNNENRKLTLMQNVEDFEFSSEELLFEGFPDISSIKFYDMNNNGFKDIIASGNYQDNGYYNRQVVYYTNIDGSSFSEPQIITNIHTYSQRFIVTDINSDGRGDIITGAWDDSITLHLNNGDNTFTAKPIYHASTGVSKWYDPITIEDIDNDGLGDLIFHSGDIEGVDLNYNWLKRTDQMNFGAAFPISRRFASNLESRDSNWKDRYPVYIIDVDNDGMKDILGVSYYDPDEPYDGPYSIFWYRNELTGPVVSNEVNDQEIPVNTSLLNNYPNPFNPTTTINFELAENSRVELEIFNLLGQKVQVVDDSFRSRGTHSVVFDAGSLSSGVYLYRLSTEEFTETKKMMLIK